LSILSSSASVPAEYGDQKDYYCEELEQHAISQNSIRLLNFIGEGRSGC